MARSGPLLTEAQWKKIAPLLPKPPKQRKGGRPWIENRRVLEGILWILRSGARWQDLPEKFPHPSTRKCASFAWSKRNRETRPLSVLVQDARGSGACASSSAATRRRRLAVNGSSMVWEKCRGFRRNLPKLLGAQGSCS